MASEEEIHGSYRLSLLLQKRTNPAIKARGGIVESCDFQRRDELCKCPSVLFWAAALRHTIIQLGQCNCGNAYITYGYSAEAVQQALRAMFDQMNADIGIEHELHRKAFDRFCMGGCVRRSDMKSSVNLSRLSKSGAQ